MLRVLRIIAILVFAVLVGISARRIQQLYTSGRLFEQYNSARRASITLFVFSVVGLGVLGYLEISRFKRHGQRRGYSPTQGDGEPVVDGLDTASIYSRPESPDKWEGLRTRTSRSRHHKPFLFDNFWMGLLRVMVFSMPVVYALLLAACLAGWISTDMPMLCGGLGFIGFLSLVAGVGIVWKKAWGLKVGYAIAMIHLLLFPVGTVIGLILLIGLVGAAPLFSLSSREQQRAARGKRQKNLRAT